jgi:hypothetical protein
MNEQYHYKVTSFKNFNDAVKFMNSIKIKKEDIVTLTAKGVNDMIFLIHIIHENQEI